MLKTGDVVWRMQGTAQNDVIKWAAVPMAIETIEENKYQLSNGGTIAKCMIGKQVFPSREECLTNFKKNHGSFEQKVIMPLPQNVKKLPRTDFENYRIYKSYTMDQILHIFFNGNRLDESDLRWEEEAGEDLDEDICYMTLGNLSTQVFSKYGSGIITVVSEAPLEGEIFQIGNHRELKWEKHGTTKGYA